MAWSSSTMALNMIARRRVSASSTTTMQAQAGRTAAAAAAAAGYCGEQYYGYHVLVEFAVRHLDFQLAELESVLTMHGIRLVFQQTHEEEPQHDAQQQQQQQQFTCRMLPLPRRQQTSSLYAESASAASSSSSSPAAKKKKVSPRRPFVILSLPFDSPFVPLSAKQPTTTTTTTVAANDESNNNNNNNSSNEDIATIILSRCTLVRSVLELWGCATALEDCARATQEWIRGGGSAAGGGDGGDGDGGEAPSTTTTTAAAATIPLPNSNAAVGPTIYRNNSQPNQSWKVTIRTLGAKYTRDEQDVMRQHFTDALALPQHCPIRMVDPTNEFVLIREVELDHHGGALYPRHSDQGGGVLIPENDARPPLACYFGRSLPAVRCGRSTHRTAVPGTQQQQSKQRRIADFSLKQRKYLGPTSMDAELSFIMTNLGHVAPGRMVLDPFVGTGSILLSCAVQGAFCVGTDIDIRILRGRSPDENIFANFRQFGLPRPELIRSDNAVYERHFRTTDDGLYDAILCDPPYGIRAGARKSGSRREHVAPVLPENRSTHIAQTQPYPVEDVMADLLDVAARTLVTGGRLVYIIPSFAKDFDAAVDLPRHSCLELVHVCFQPLGPDLGRRMVALRKCADYDVSKRAEYRAAVWKNGAASAEKCANLRDKILENAKKKPNYEEKLAIRKAKRKQTKEEKKAAKRRATEQEEAQEETGQQEAEAPEKEIS